MGSNDFTDEIDSSGGDDLAGVLSPMSTDAMAAAKNRRNNVILAVLVLVGVGIAVKQFVTSGTKSASAATTNTGVATGTGAGRGAKASAVEQFLSAGAGDMKAARELMRHTEQVVQTFKTYPSVNQVPLGSLKVNPFQQHPLAKGADGDEASASRQSRERADATTAAQSLQLRSILHSKIAPACLMNNMLLREQQAVNGFVVERINPSSVIVHRGIYRFEVRLLK